MKYEYNQLILVLNAVLGLSKIEHRDFKAFKKLWDTTSASLVISHVIRSDTRGRLEGMQREVIHARLPSDLLH